jgi:hypothetical protein
VTIEAGVLALRITEQGAEDVEKKLDRIDQKGKKIGNTPIKVPIAPPSSTDLTLIDRQLEQMGKQIPLYKQGAQFASTKKQSLKELGDVEHQLRNIVAGSNTTLEQRIGAEKQLAQLESLRPARMKANATALGGMSSAIGTATKALGAMGVVLSAGALVSGFTSMVRDAINAGDALHDLAMRTGASTESLSVMGVAAAKSDVSTGQLTVGFKTLAKSVEQLRAGNKGAVADFAALGLSAKDLEGLSLDQMFVKIADAQARFNDGTGKSATMTAIFGRSGEALIPMMHELADGGFDRARQRAEELGAVIGPDFADKADRFNDGMTDMSTAVRGLGMAIADAALPQMTALSAKFTELISKSREWLPEALNIAGKIYLGLLGPVGWGAMFGLSKMGGPSKLDKDLLQASLPSLPGAIVGGLPKDKTDIVRRIPTAADNKRAAEIAKAMAVPGMGFGDLVGGTLPVTAPGLMGVDSKGKMQGVKADFLANNFGPLADPTSRARFEARWEEFKKNLEQKRELFTGLALGVAESISGALADGFTAAFSGDENFFAALGKSLLSSLGNILVQIGASMVTYGALMTPLAGIPGPWQALGLGAMASLAAGVGLMALGAGMGALAGGGSKGSSGGGDGGSGRTAKEERDDYAVAFDPDRKLRKSGPAVMPGSRGLSNAPMPEGRPVVHIGTINSLSPDDAKWQRAVADTYNNARNRGLVRSG